MWNRLDYLAHGGTTALNLGAGHGHSVLEVIEAVREVTGRDIPTLLTDRRPGDPPVLNAAADKARSLLGWQPRHTDLPEILRHDWNWHRQRQSRTERMVSMLQGPADKARQQSA